MPKTIVPRRLRKPAQSERAKRAAATRTRREVADFHDMLRVELVAARAVTMTAVLATEGRGVHDEVSIALRGVVRRIDIVLESLAGTA